MIIPLPQANIVRVGLNYHFNWTPPPPPVVTKTRPISK
jgi:hypothetical protein